MIISFPVVLLETLYWQLEYDQFVQTRALFYFGFICMSTPTAIIALAKPNEDCIDCFNRCAPGRYSVFQFSIPDLLCMSLDQEE